MSRYEIPSHLADYSVTSPPIGFNPKSFQQKFIGPYVDDIHLTLDSWISNVEEKDGDLLLQMDIEGGEYLSIIATPQETLKRFRVIVVEVHGVESWGEPLFFQVVEDFFGKLLIDFCIVHNHPNNCCGIVNLGGFLAPRVFELTFIRKDRIKQQEHRSDFPHMLDRPNLLDRPDLPLPPNWYQSLV